MAGVRLGTLISNGTGAVSNERATEPPGAAGPGVRVALRGGGGDGGDEARLVSGFHESVFQALPHLRRGFERFRRQGTKAAQQRGVQFFRQHRAAARGELPREHGSGTGGQELGNVRPRRQALPEIRRAGIFNKF